MKDVVIKDVKRKTNVDRLLLIKVATLAYEKLNNKKPIRPKHKTEKVA